MASNANLVMYRGLGSLHLNPSIQLVLFGGKNNNIMIMNVLIVFNIFIIFRGITVVLSVSGLLTY